MVNDYKPMGGSELAYYILSGRLPVGWEQEINLILSFCDYKFIDPTKINIIWQQLNWNEETVAGMNDQTFIDTVDHFVWVSNWQYNRYREKFSIPAYKSSIIKNATMPAIFKERSRWGKLKLIYTSTPWRGLDVVLEAFRLLNRDDIELDIFSSTKIYGPNFEKLVEGQFDWLFDVAKNMPGVNYYGYAPNEQVRESVNNAHIFAYPNTFEETSCMSAMEALISGCRVVTTNYGALPETCGDWARYVTYDENRPLLAQRYARVLEEEINNYWTEETQNLIRRQSEHYNRFYSWDVRIKEWEHIFEIIKRNKINASN